MPAKVEKLNSRLIRLKVVPVHKDPCAGHGHGAEVEADAGALEILLFIFFMYRGWLALSVDRQRFIGEGEADDVVLAAD